MEEREIREAQLIRAALQFMESTREQGVLTITGEGVTIPIPPKILSAFIEVLTIYAHGEEVVIEAAKKLLTTGEAARKLGTSRQHMGNLIERGELENVQIHSHRRIRAKDLEAYQKRLEQQRLEALQGLEQLDTGEEEGAWTSS